MIVLTQITKLSLLLGGLIFSIANLFFHFVDTVRMSAFITATTLSAAVLAIFLEEYLKKRQAKGNLLFTLVHEVALCANYAEDPYFKLKPGEKEVIYPIFPTSAFDAALCSALLLSKKDRKLFNLLLYTRQHIFDVNTKSRLTETLSFLGRSINTNTPINESISFRKLTEYNLQLLELLLSKKYSKLTGISNTTRILEMEKPAVF